ncbi:hypothetical protein AVEN_181935-1 [Araneus ventricosus]|uniref:Uncharacterized protein n=1 Tax=Araneus ventricosus TaxID=182803 RepID=A0A4Y2TUX1_ARAVE|nr:hypothetical protein AVEN_181935-1 [Araneus ventricosus]
MSEDGRRSRSTPSSSSTAFPNQFLSPTLNPCLKEGLCLLINGGNEALVASRNNELQSYEKKIDESEAALISIGPCPVLSCTKHHFKVSADWRYPMLHSGLYSKCLVSSAGVIQPPPLLYPTEKRDSAYLYGRSLHPGNWTSEIHSVSKVARMTRPNRGRMLPRR